VGLPAVSFKRESIKIKGILLHRKIKKSGSYPLSISNEKALKAKAFYFIVKSIK
jgi:hypothetical protein